MYLTISNDDTLNNLALNLIYREREIYQYQFNIDNYTAILASSPQEEVPAEVAEYIDTAIENLPLSLSIDLVKLIAAYQNKNRIAYLLRTENIEQDKAKSIYNAIKAQIPAEQLDALVADALVKVNAQTTA